MATPTKQTRTVEIVAAWVPPSLAREVKEPAEAERRSVSATIRLAVEDQLRGKRR